MADGPALNRPPQRLFAALDVSGTGGFVEELFMVNAKISHSGRIVGAALFGFTLLAAPAWAQGASDMGKLSETKPARPVPALTLTDLDKEQPTDLTAYKGKPLI